MKTGGKFRKLNKQLKHGRARQSKKRKGIKEQLVQTRDPYGKKGRAVRREASLGGGRRRLID